MTAGSLSTPVEFASAGPCHTLSYHVLLPSRLVAYVAFFLPRSCKSYPSLIPTLAFMSLGLQTYVCDVCDVALNLG